MKLHTTKSHIERGNVHSESAFTIKTTAKAFDILSSGLYTDAVTAIVRELSCNAHDAHIAAGKQDEPFIIHLPNTLEPFFSVKDVGTGLSDEQIRGMELPTTVEHEDGTIEHLTDDNGKPMYHFQGGLYTTYFDSTKSDSNDFIGALGLGSKSPFSYSNAFDVISHYEGTKYIYSIFLNEDGIPSVALLGKVETNEPNGLEVKITVEESDFRRFVETTASVLRYFPVTPTVVGYPHFNFIQLPKYRIEGDGWFVAPKNWSANRFTAVQGNVPYRVNTNSLKDILTSEERSFLDVAELVVYFDIGELDVAANREEIRYDEDTKQSLVRKMRQVRSDLTNTIQRKLEPYEDSLWNYYIEANKLSTELFKNSHTLSRFVVQESITSKYLNKYIKSGGHVDVHSLFKHEVVQYTIGSLHAGRINRTKLEQSTPAPSDEYTIMYNDAKTKGISRIRNHLLRRKAKKIIAITPLTTPAAYPKGVQSESYDEEYARIVENLGHPEISLVSEATDNLPSPKKRLPPFYQYCGKERLSESWNWRPKYKLVWEKTTSVDINTDTLYVHIENGSSVIFGDHQIKSADNTATSFHDAAIQAMISAINRIKGTSYSTSSLVGVSKSAYKTIAKNPKWTNLFTEYNKCIPEFDEGLIFYARLIETSNLLGLHDIIKDDPTFVSEVNQLSDQSLFKKTIMPVIEGHKKFNDDEDFYKTLLRFDKTYGDGLYVDNQPPFYDNTVFDKYSMLSFINTLSIGSDWQPLFDYIKLIDGTEK